MKTPGVALVFALLSTHLSAQSMAPAAQLPSIELPPELARVLRDYEKAWQSHDAAALAELFAEDGFVLASTQSPVRGRAAIRAAYSAAGGRLSLRAFAYATADSIGYIIGGFSSAAGNPDSGKFVLTLKRKPEGRWLIMSDMDNSNQRSSWNPPPSLSVTPFTPTPGH